MPVGRAASEERGRRTAPALENAIRVGVVTASAIESLLNRGSVVRAGQVLRTLAWPAIIRYTYLMAKSIDVIQKKRGRGRPATGTAPLIALRMPPEERQAVEAWAAKQPNKLSLSMAIRRLVERGLAAGEPPVTKRARTK